MFNAIGPPCQAETIYHTFLPALSIVPNLLISGILALFFGLTMIIWSLFFLPKRRGGLFLMLMSPLQMVRDWAETAVTQFSMKTDQSGLIGLLRHLHGLGFVFLSVDCES